MSNELGDTNIYDFFYQDAPRIASYLAQFGTSGHLQTVKEVSGTDVGGQTDAQFKAGLSLGVINVKVGHADRNGTTQKASLEKTFDPLWANVLNLIKKLTDRNLISENIQHAQYGNFILCSGSLVVLETGFLQQLYKTDAFKKRARMGAINPITNELVSDDEFELGAVAIQHAALQIQAHLITGMGAVWTTLRPDGLTTPMSEILYKYGPIIDGNWKMLAIKDANPQLSLEHLAVFSNMLAKIYPGTVYVPEVAAAATLVRAMFGRPANAYGVTPIAIFRSVHGA